MDAEYICEKELCRELCGVKAVYRLLRDVPSGEYAIHCCMENVEEGLAHSVTTCKEFAHRVFETVSAAEVRPCCLLDVVADLIIEEMTVSYG